MSVTGYSYLQGPSDLVTTREATRAGFVAAVLEKSRLAGPHIAEARALLITARELKSPDELLNMPSLRSALVMAAGVSGKAKVNITKSDADLAVRHLIDTYLKPAGEKFADELVYRFLLGKGETMGGTLKNVLGAIAQRKLIRAIMAELGITGRTYQYLDAGTSRWARPPQNDAGLELVVRGLHWKADQSNRVLLLNILVPVLGKNNVDLVLLNVAPEDMQTDNTYKEVIADGSRYVALGELKGGIDPAGADEHWKTALSALDRIGGTFAAKGFSPAIGFIGGAIARKMAAEIWQRLSDGRITSAANLTNEEQTAGFCSWLCSL